LFAPRVFSARLSCSRATGPRVSLTTIRQTATNILDAGAQHSPNTRPGFAAAPTFAAVGTSVVPVSSITTGSTASVLVIAFVMVLASASAIASVTITGSALGAAFVHAPATISEFGAVFVVAEEIQPAVSADQEIDVNVLDMDQRERAVGNTVTNTFAAPGICGREAGEA
jgi:hypothetical protein